MIYVTLRSYVIVVKIRAIAPKGRKGEGGDDRRILHVRYLRGGGSYTRQRRRGLARGSRRRREIDTIFNEKIFS